MMGELGGFLKISRHGIQYEDPTERAVRYDENVIRHVVLRRDEA